MVIWILFIISIVVSTLIINSVQRLFMKWMGASAMTFRAKPKVIAIIVIALILTSIVIQVLGIQIPK